MSKVILETKRLRLRELAASDLDFVARMLADAEVMRYYPQCLDRAASLAWIERQQMRYTRDGHGLWLVLDRETDKPVGQVGLVMHELKGLPRSSYPEIGIGCTDRSGIAGSRPRRRPACATTRFAPDATTR